MRKLLIISALCLSLSCDKSPTGLPRAAFEGPWELTVQANNACAGATGAHVRFFDVETSSYQDGAFNVVTSWDVVTPDRGYGWLVTGNFNLEARTVELNFWQRTGSVGSIFTGIIRDDGTITGTVRDPKPNYLPHFVIGSCTFSASGRRYP